VQCLTLSDPRRRNKHESFQTDARPNTVNSTYSKIWLQLYKSIGNNNQMTVLLVWIILTTFALIICLTIKSHSITLVEVMKKDMFNREATKSKILDGIEWWKEYMLKIPNS
jgi:hypothetical protein